MKRRVAREPDAPKRPKKRNTPNPRTGRETEISIERQAADVALRKAVFQGVLRSVPKQRLAEQLGVELKVVNRISSFVCQEYLIENKPHVAALVAEQIARHQHLAQALYLEAHGGAYVDAEGNRVEVKRVPEATHAYQRTMRDLDILLGGKSAVINIGSIDVSSQVNTQVNVEVQAPSPADAARLVRAYFPVEQNIRRLEDGVGPGQRGPVVADPIVEAANDDERVA